MEEKGTKIGYEQDVWFLTSIIELPVVSQCVIELELSLWCKSVTVILCVHVCACERALAVLCLFVCVPPVMYVCVYSSREQLWCGNHQQGPGRVLSTSHPPGGRGGLLVRCDLILPWAEEASWSGVISSSRGQRRPLGRVWSHPFSGPPGGPVMAHAQDDPQLGAGPSEDSELSENESETASLVSEDSIMPDYEMERGSGGTTSTLYEACNRNEALTLQRVLERGVTKEEVMELDINGMVRTMSCFPQVVLGSTSIWFLSALEQCFSTFGLQTGNDSRDDTDWSLRWLAYTFLVSYSNVHFNVRGPTRRKNKSLAVSGT